MARNGCNRADPLGGFLDERLKTEAQAKSDAAEEQKPRTGSDSGGVLVYPDADLACVVYL